MTCATCQWSRPAVPRVRQDRERADRGMWDWKNGSPPDYQAERILCNRMPQAVENDADYVCGEYIRKRGEAA